MQVINYKRPDHRYLQALAVRDLPNATGQTGSKTAKALSPVCPRQPTVHAGTLEHLPVTHPGLWRSTHTISGYSCVCLGGNSTPCTVPRMTVSNNTMYSAPCCTNGLFVLRAPAIHSVSAGRPTQGTGLLSHSPRSAGQVTFSLIGTLG